MSADLLAEFDSFYQPPPNKNNSGTTISNTQAEAFDDLSFFGAVSTPNTNAQPQSQGHASNPNLSDDIWGDFGGSGPEGQSHLAIKSIPDSWSNFEPAGRADVSTILELSSRPKTKYEGVMHQRFNNSVGSQKPGIIETSTDELFSGNKTDLPDSVAVRARLQSSVTQSDFLHQTNANLGRGTDGSGATEVVLFDAADELDVEGYGEDDEFGDFESVQPPISQVDLLQINDPVSSPEHFKRPEPLSSPSPSLIANPYPYPQAPKSPSFQERNPFADLGLNTSSITYIEKDNTVKNESPVTAWPVFVPEILKPAPYKDTPTTQNSDDEEWGDFADLPTETNLKTSKSISGIEVDAWAWDTMDNKSASIQAKDIEALPPTNIPPPSVLLRIFPQLFDLPQSNLFKNVANQPFSLKNRILSDPATIDFLRGYILIATVAARIIAGRKLRWKRDIHLSQAMKIGPAASGGKGGMKLTGIDKAESVREEREVTEVVRIWKEQVGRLRSAVATTNSSIHDKSTHLVVPGITETMLAKAEGGLTAPKACVLCGLKREERIVKVDNKVEDSFGEWWVDHWGHTACKNFWQEHEDKLKTH